MAVAFLDSVGPDGSVEYGKAAIGQAYLRYGTDAPVVLQLTGRARVQGMWSMGTVARDNPGWEPLKSELSRFGGVTATGGSSGVLLSDLRLEDVEHIVTAAVAATERLVAEPGEAQF
jgi:hypothetical protein